MAWWMVAAAAAPYVAAALQKKPKRPGAPAPVQMTNRDGHINQMMDTAFNPNNAQWIAAQQRTMDEVNRALGRKNLGSSSIGMQMQGNAQASLAEAWLKDKAAREMNAMNAATNYDQAQAGHAAGQSQQQHGYAMDAYKDAMQRNSNQVQGISNLVNAGVGYYNQQQMMDMMRRDPYPQVSYGVPGPAPIQNYSVYDAPAGATYQPSGGSMYGVPGVY